MRNNWVDATEPSRSTPMMLGRLGAGKFRYIEKPDIKGQQSIEENNKEITTVDERRSIREVRYLGHFEDQQNRILKTMANVRKCKSRPPLTKKHREKRENWVRVHEA